MMSTRWSRTPTITPASCRSGALRSEVTPLQAWPDVPCSYIVCTDDRTATSAWACRAARERLGGRAYYRDPRRSLPLSLPPETTRRGAGPVYLVSRVYCCLSLPLFTELPRRSEPVETVSWRSIDGLTDLCGRC